MKDPSVTNSAGVRHRSPGGLARPPLVPLAGACWPARLRQPRVLPGLHWLRQDKIWALGPWIRDADVAQLLAHRLGGRSNALVAPYTAE
jgi:hypothetical protein